ncbi:hypothetical protein HC251_12210 [Iamia sp. SCSIO 61187]|uniref:VOC family protein n=1 Tax=Iamia sp. SCSIO 61187 TaxID=2722752 RepID=UPI001C63A60B|nr:VOC family protein [Iamia sp. SCSIO 61187]QYG93122.1 hypothetical protein HC251_12210 [Iamia sp. SCSIO 61187]
MADELTATDLAADETLADWRYLLNTIVATYRAPSLTEAAAFVTAVAALAAEGGSDVDVDLRPPGVVRVGLPAPDLVVPGGSVALARATSDRAAGDGLVAVPSQARLEEIAIDVLDMAAVKPFWQAALAYEDDGADAIVDPLRLGPSVWFQPMDALRPERNHIHIDITVPHDVADQRVADVVAAGGTIRYRRDRAFTVLADREGNEVCICTWLDRG